MTFCGRPDCGDTTTLWRRALACSRLVREAAGLIGFAEGDLTEVEAAELGRMVVLADWIAVVTGRGVVEYLRGELAALKAAVRAAMPSAPAGSPAVVDPLRARRDDPGGPGPPQRPPLVLLTDCMPVGPPCAPAFPTPTIRREELAA